MAVSGVTVLGLWYYFHREQAKLRQKSKKNAFVCIPSLLEEEAAGTLGTPKIGGPFTLLSHRGTPFSWPADMQGAHSLIYFGFTHCPDICPEELEKITEAVSMVEEKTKGQGMRLQPIFITCDPDRDDPAAIASYLKGTIKMYFLIFSFEDFHPSFIGVTGSMQDVKDAARLFRVYFKAARTGGAAASDDYLVDHTIFYYLMDPEGKYVTHFGRDHRPSDVANGIIEAMQAYKHKMNNEGKK